MRLDQTLVARGLVPSRARAQDLIKRGFVSVAGQVCGKPALDVNSDQVIEVARDAPAYVSRGAEKLAAALDHFGFEASGKVALDVGASTGGFTQVLLERGAARVFAVDVGSGQLHPDVKGDPRVTAFENFDARNLTVANLETSVDAIVVDVSFISVTKVLDAVLPLAAENAWLVVLVKPQFEVGRENIGSGGIVRDPVKRQAALEGVRSWIADRRGWSIAGEMISPILGGSGNEEFLLGAVRSDG
ncbi:TlyA family rRNA (cytidine-2'-O)-methyltransferase [Hyphomicrobium methylovorum]|uniref:TlyA family RNA methyltransferase n=1 Tax=Hyphomicrobium methylovorum TaxID=84 RepID=UPI0015E6E8A8|nr:TlyA family RNA methyltransferase [Hyphomicrobium methylovorum]MBA2127299.1 TlyA family rRNA (cytidine-2'-O)-methyltransferase [Hyphomicrobium methylovorum]